MPFPRPLTVALASTQAGYYGGEEQARLLAAGLRSRGHRCVILARRGGEFAQCMERAGFEVLTFKGRGQTPAALWQQRKALSRLRPDVLHFNDSHALTYLGFAAGGLPIPARLVSRRVDFRLRAAGRYRRGAEMVLCVSRGVRDVCRQAGLPDEQLCVVHDGVEPTRMSNGNRQRGRQSLGVSPGQPLLLTVAKLTDHKGHRYLLDALPAVLDRFPDLQLVLAGEGELRQSLEEQMRELRIERHVRLLGYRDDIPDLLAAADLFVIPSHLEGLCSSIIDAMFAGCPVVATRAGGIPDLLEDSCGSTVGWQVNPRSAAGLATALIEALGDAERRRQLAENARQRAHTHFTHDVMVDATLQVYRRLLSRRQRAA